MDESRKNRTEQKLRYAELHLQELEQMPPGRGHDFERAHLEAVFAQLVGAYDALLLEINDILNCGLIARDAKLPQLIEAKKSRCRSSAVLHRLNDLRKDDESWLHHLLDLRNTSIHEAGIPLAFNADDGTAAFRYPVTLKNFPDDAHITLSKWLVQMRVLTNGIRKDANLEATVALNNGKSGKD